MISEDYYFCDQECYDCQTKQDTIDEVKYWLNIVVEQIYSTSELNEASFEDDLDELCTLLKIKLPKGAPQIVRKPKEAPMPEYVSHWLQFNKSHLETLKSI
jgi:hypothetical protein